MQLSGLQEAREAARLLVARATRHAAKGRGEQALADLLSCHRLGRLVGQDVTFVGGLAGIAIEGMAIGGATVVIDSRAATPKQLEDFLVALTKLPTSRSMAERIHRGERLLFLDAAVVLARRQTGEDGQEFLGKRFSDRLKETAGHDIKWDFVLRDGNDWYDRLHAAMSKQTHAQRQAAMDEIFADIERRAARRCWCSYCQVRQRDINRSAIPCNKRGCSGRASSRHAV